MCSSCRSHSTSCMWSIPSVDEHKNLCWHKLAFMQPIACVHSYWWHKHAFAARDEPHSSSFLPFHRLNMSTGDISYIDTSKARISWSTVRIHRGNYNDVPSSSFSKVTVKKGFTRGNADTIHPTAEGGTKHKALNRIRTSKTRSSAIQVTRTGLITASSKQSEFSFTNFQAAFSAKDLLSR